MKLDLEADVEDASDEVCSFEIQISLKYLKSICTQEDLGILSPTFCNFLVRIPLEEGLLQEIPSYSTRTGAFSVKLLNYLQQRLYSLVKEKFLSMLGSRICPIEQTLVIIQVARQLLPRVTPEETFVEVSHCFGLDQDTHLHKCERLWTVLLPSPSIHLWLASFFNLLSQIGGASIGFTATWILALSPSLPVQRCLLMLEMARSENVLHCSHM